MHRRRRRPPIGFSLPPGWFSMEPASWRRRRIITWSPLPGSESWGLSGLSVSLWGKRLKMPKPLPMGRKRSRCFSGPFSAGSFSLPDGNGKPSRPASPCYSPIPARGNSLSVISMRNANGSTGNGSRYSLSGSSGSRRSPWPPLKSLNNLSMRLSRLRKTLHHLQAVAAAAGYRADRFLEMLQPGYLGAQNK